MANVPGLVTDPSKIKGGVVHIPSGGTKIPGYLAQPNTPGNYPGIVVIMEAFGLADHICDIARRFANIGYNAIAPDLYWRDGNPTDPGDFNTVAPVMFGLKDSQAVGDLNASADFLNGLAGATGKIGAIGFCSGGRHTLLFACSSNKVNAAEAMPPARTADQEIADTSDSALPSLSAYVGASVTASLPKWSSCFA